MAVLQHIIGTLLCTSSQLLTPPKMEVSYLGPQCCSTKRVSWAGLPQVEALCEYRAGGLSCQNHCWVQPEECLWHGNSPATVWNCFLWLEGRLQLSGRDLAPQYWFQACRIPLSHICWFSSFPLQAPWAAQVAGALLSGHKTLTVRLVVNVSSSSPRVHREIRLALCPVYSAGCLRRYPRHPTHSTFFPAKCTLVLNHLLPFLINGHECDKTSALVPLILRLSLEKQDAVEVIVLFMLPS